MWSRCNSRALSDYLDGVMSGRRAKALERHLARCSRCAKEIYAFTRLRDLLRGWDWFADSGMPDPSGVHPFNGNLRDSRSGGKRGTYVREARGSDEGSEGKPKTSKGVFRHHTDVRLCVCLPLF